MGYNYRQNVIYFWCFIDYYTHVKVFLNVSVKYYKYLPTRGYSVYHVSDTQVPTRYDWYHSSLFHYLMFLDLRMIFSLIDETQNEFLVYKYILIETRTGRAQEFFLIMSSFHLSTCSQRFRNTWRAFFNKDRIKYCAHLVTLQFYK